MFRAIFPLTFVLFLSSNAILAQVEGGNGGAETDGAAALRHRAMDEAVRRLVELRHKAMDEAVKGLSRREVKKQFFFTLRGHAGRASGGGPATL